MRNKYPRLHYWFGCYLNQDYDLEFGSPDAALTAYKSKEVEEEQQQLKQELADLIDLNVTESAMQNLLLDQLDCEYFYLSEWSSSKEWLKHIYHLLDE
jgi:hypothetical protein